MLVELQTAARALPHGVAVGYALLVAVAAVFFIGNRSHFILPVFRRLFALGHWLIVRPFRSMVLRS